MGGFLSLYDEKEKVELAPGYWVELRKTLSKEDYDAAQRALFRIETIQAGGSDPDGSYRGETDTVAYQTEIVARSITDWNLTDHAGEPLPRGDLHQTKVSISRLPQSAFLTLYLKVDAWNTPEPEGSPKSDGGGVLDPDGAENGPGRAAGLAEVPTREGALGEAGA